MNYGNITRYVKCNSKSGRILAHCIWIDVFLNFFISGANVLNLDSILNVFVIYYKYIVYSFKKFLNGLSTLE